MTAHPRHRRAGRPPAQHSLPARRRRAGRAVVLRLGGHADAHPRGLRHHAAPDQPARDRRPRLDPDRTFVLAGLGVVALAVGTDARSPRASAGGGADLRRDLRRRADRRRAVRHGPGERLPGRHPRRAGARDVLARRRRTRSRPPSPSPRWPSPPSCSSSATSAAGARPAGDRERRGRARPAAAHVARPYEHADRRQRPGRASPGRPSRLYCGAPPDRVRVPAHDHRGSP